MTTDTPAQIPPFVQNTEETAKKTRQGKLQSKNVRIHNRRTSVRLEPEMWSALNEISSIEGCSIHDLCSAVSDLKEAGSSFTAALRVFLMEYYRTATKTDQKVNQVQKRLGMNLQQKQQEQKPAQPAMPIPQKVIA